MESNPYQKQAFGVDSFQQLFANTIVQEDEVLSIYDWLNQTNYIKNTKFICKILTYIHDNIDPNGLFPTTADDKCFISTASEKNKINLSVSDSTARNSIINEILNHFNDKAKEVTDKDLVEKVTKFNHELWFYPNKKNPNVRKYTLTKIHFTKAEADKDLNKVSSDITEFSVAFALRLSENGGKNNPKVKQFLAIDDTQDYIDFVQSEFDYLKSVSTEASMNSLINGMVVNIDRPKIKKKVNDGIKLATYVIESLSTKDKISKTKVTNDKQKTDTADVETYVNGTRVGYSIKADVAEGKMHSLKDFSVFKFVNLYPEFSKLLYPISFDKFISYVNSNKESYTKDWNIVQLTVNDYARWMATNDVVKKFSESMNDYKSIYAKMLKIVFNIDSVDTVILTLSGIDDQRSESGTQATISNVLNDLENAFDRTSTIQLVKKEGNLKTVKCIIETQSAQLSFNMIFGSGADHTFKNEIWQDIPTSKLPKFVPIYIKFNSLEVKRY